MSTDEQDLEAFGRRAGEHLRSDAAGMDAATRTRLAQARAAALDAARPQRLSAARLLVPAGALASAALLAVLLTPGDQVEGDGVNALAAAALYDLELIADGDAWALSEEADLEFIEWAAGMAELEGPGG